MPGLMSRGRMIRSGATDERSGCDTVDLYDNTWFLVDCRSGAGAEFPCPHGPARARAGLSTLLMTVGFWLACAPPALADGQVWLLASVTKTLAVDWRLNLDFAPRWERDARTTRAACCGLQVARVLGKQVTRGGRLRVHRAGLGHRQARASHLEQVQVQQRVGGWTLSHRGRLEQRWLHLAPSVVVRTRYQLRASHPIRQSGRWSWLLPDEVLYTLRGTALGPMQGLDRHRLGGGISPRSVGSRHRRGRLHLAGHQPPRPPLQPARPLRRLRPLRPLLTGVGP